MNPEVLSRLENGQGNPSLGTMENIAGALEVKLPELLGASPTTRGPLNTLVALLADQPPRVQARALAVVRAMLKD